MLSIVKALFGMVIPVFTMRYVVVSDPLVLAVMFRADILPENAAPVKLALVDDKPFKAGTKVFTL